MIKELKLKFPLFQTKFFDHEKLKKSLIDKINKSNHNDTNGINDSIEKFDWNIAKDIERDWVKELIQPIYSQLNVFAQKMGYRRLTIKQIWFQKYVKNSVHNWHIHGDNYTGVYYLKLPIIGFEKKVAKAAMGRAMFSQTVSKAPGKAQRKETYIGSYIKSEIDGKYISNKSYESYYGDMLKGFK